MVVCLFSIFPMNALFLLKKRGGIWLKIHKHIDGHFIIGKIDINVSISQTVKYPLSDYLHIPTRV